MLEEFKKFAMRGNVVDLAVGVIIGVAFGTIVTSLVARHHHAGHRRGHRRARFLQLFHPLSSKVTADSLVEAKKQGAVLAWGNFLTVVINFLIIAWVLFLMIQADEQAHAERGGKAPALTKQETLLTEIRDLLKAEKK